MDLPTLLQKLDRKFFKGSATGFYLFMALCLPVASIMLGRDVHSLFYLFSIPSLWVWWETLKLTQDPYYIDIYDDELDLTWDELEMDVETDYSVPISKFDDDDLEFDDDDLELIEDDWDTDED